MRVFLLFSEYNQHVVLRLKVHGYDQGARPSCFCTFYLLSMDLYAFLKLRMAAIRATNKMMGSASMKMGILPDVSVTSVDESSVRLHPQVRMIRPFWSLCLMCAIPCAIKHTTRLKSGYKSKMLRGMVPLALPSRS